MKQWHPYDTWMLIIVVAWGIVTAIIFIKYNDENEDY